MIASRVGLLGRFVCSAFMASFATSAAVGAATLTCDRGAINPASYRLTTTAQALNVTQQRSDWWDGFVIGKHAGDLDDLNHDTRHLAERALEIDPRNLMAHSLLARQYVILDEIAPASDEWSAVFDAGGAIVWSATLYDVDSKSYFLMAFDRAGIRVYRMGQFTGPIARHLGMAQFPGPEATKFYEAWAGCPDASIAPDASVAWSDVREIKSGNWVLWFKLSRPVTISSDRGKRKTLDEIKVNLHGETGSVEFLASDPWGSDLRGIGIGPTAYQQRVRGMIAKFVDPEGRIKLPAAKRGAGW